MASTASRRRVGLVYGEDGLFRRAGCVVVDMDAKAVLLVESRRPGVWTIPAGKVEMTNDGAETDLEAAVRETREEAGAVGTVLYDLGDDFVSETNRTHVYVLGTTPSALLPPSDYDDGKRRKRDWVPFEAATANVTKAIPRAALDRAVEAVSNASRPSDASPAAAGDAAPTSTSPEGHSSSSAAVCETEVAASGAPL